MCFNGFYRIEATLSFSYFWSKQEKVIGGNETWVACENLIGIEV